MQRTYDPGHQHQQCTEPGGHDDHVVQGTADGQEAVIGHHGQEEDVQSYKECEKMHLDNAAFISYNFVLCLYIHQHLWDGGGGEADVYKGQVGEEEVHRGVEVGV